MDFALAIALIVFVVQEGKVDGWESRHQLPRQNAFVNVVFIVRYLDGVDNRPPS